MHFTRTIVEHYLGQSEDHIISKNRNLSNPRMAYDHLIATTITAIRSRIFAVGNCNQKCNNLAEFTEFVETVKIDLVYDIISNNQNTNTFINPSFENFDQTKGNKYYQFAKDTFVKVESGELPLYNLNKDALLAYNIYRITDHSMKSALILDEKNYVAIDEDSKYVKDYNEYMAESTVVPTEETTDSPIA